MQEAIGSLEKYLGALKEFRSQRQGILVYRGHPRANWRLVPHVLRQPKYRRNESKILREMIAAEPTEFEHDHSTFDRLVRAQHYTAPTRLLDVTKNPLVALYFAASQPAGDGEVILIRVQDEKIKYFDSDTVSILSNLAQLSEDERKSIDISTPRAFFSDTAPVARLLQFVRQEKPYFLSDVNPTDLGTAFLVRPKLSNKRIIAQSGQFLIYGLLKSWSDHDIAGISMERLQIAEGAKTSILRDLDVMAINGHTLFPDIENAARYITRSL